GGGRVRCLGYYYQIETGRPAPGPAELERKLQDWHPLGGTDSDPAEQWENGLRALVRSICGGDDAGALEVAKATMRANAPDYVRRYDTNLFTAVYGEVCAAVKEFYYGTTPETDAWRQARSSLNQSPSYKEDDGGNDEDASSTFQDNVVDHGDPWQAHEIEY